MKKYTHAWLAFMAIKRLEYAPMPDKYKEYATSLVAWFKDHRDAVVQGSWYPDEVFKDMATSHVLKYTPGEEYRIVKFKSLPKGLKLTDYGKQSKCYKVPYTIDSGNGPDRCEAISHSIVDNLKIMYMEEKGSPIIPSGNHIALRFYILSHYIVDLHMPLHCDSRSFSSYSNIHGYIEDQWEKQVNASYVLDKTSERFFYDAAGYPLKSEKPSVLTEAVEKEIMQRDFIFDWGSGNNNAYDYMNAITQYSYLTSYHLIPAEHKPKTLTKTIFKSLDFWKNFDPISTDLLSDAIDSVARVWLHIWIRYLSWEESQELTKIDKLREELRKEILMELK